MSGKLLDYACNDHNLEHINEAGLEITQDLQGEQIPPVTEEDCKYGGKYGLIANFVSDILFAVYFTYVMMKWSQAHSDDYHK